MARQTLVGAISGTQGGKLVVYKLGHTVMLEMTDLHGRMVSIEVEDDQARVGATLFSRASTPHHFDSHG